jgi:hypothetical protein
LICHGMTAIIKLLFFDPATGDRPVWSLGRRWIKSEPF